MTARRKILGRAFVLAALTALAGAAVANASPSRGQHGRELVGRVASLSATGFTINGKVVTATSSQLTGLAEGQCVEVKTRPANGALRVTRIKREDRCAPLLAPATTSPTTTPVVTDDPAQHDVGDDRATDPTPQVAGDDQGTSGGDDALPGHDGSDDRGQHGSDD